MAPSPLQRDSSEESDGAISLTRLQTSQRIGDMRGKKRKNKTAMGPHKLNAAAEQPECEAQLRKQRAAPPTVAVTSTLCSFFEHFRSPLPVLPFCTADGWQFAAILFVVVVVLHSFALALTYLARREGLRELRLSSRRQCGRKG